MYEDLIYTFNHKVGVVQNITLFISSDLDLDVYKEIDDYADFESEAYGVILYEFWRDVKPEFTRISRVFSECTLGVDFFFSRQDEHHFFNYDYSSRQNEVYVVLTVYSLSEREDPREDGRLVRVEERIKRSTKGHSTAEANNLNKNAATQINELIFAYHIQDWTLEN